MMEDLSPKSQKKVDVEALNERLYVQQKKKTRDAEDRREKELKANETRHLANQRKLTKEELEGMVGRVYTAQVAKKVQRLEKNQQELEAQSKRQHRTMNSSDMTDMVQRMFTAEVERRKVKERALEQKYQPPPPKKKLDREKEKEVNARLYEDTKGKRDRIRGELYQKYNAHDIPPSKKLGKEQQEAMAARLSAKS
eukprot:TRINITY_DN2823_c0_g1_i1.p1 TRINITY_DN2823_c0_g1~~TRINITY_DN2823_c0_g1_i1.p1  ORF type:complete len:196 (+),score=66.82 TRINITY_DN2823_c0_g1_i1:125-712(+)